METAYGDGVVRIRLRESAPADPARGWVPALHFTILAAPTDEPIGLLSLRLGANEWLTRFAGQIAYAIAPEHRGHRHASRALRLVAPVAFRLGLIPLWATCDPANAASRRTCELAGAELVEIVALPAGCDMYERGERWKCRYRLAPPEPGDR
jgi:tagatose 1,6-diphosphate aldolase